MKKIFLAVVGFTYLYLAIWCSLKPDETSHLVGFDLNPGSGQSEFLAVYGGLEFALAVIFLLPLIRPKQVESSLLACLIVHACLVLFRNLSLFLYSGIQPMTFKLAIGEWMIFLAAAGLVGRERRSAKSD